MRRDRRTAAIGAAPIATAAAPAANIGVMLRQSRASSSPRGGRVVLGATSERVHQRAAELGDAAVGVIADLTVDGAADSLVRGTLLLLTLATGQLFGAESKAS